MRLLFWLLFWLLFFLCIHSKQREQNIGLDPLICIHFKQHELHIKNSNGFSTLHTMTEFEKIYNGFAILINIILY